MKILLLDIETAPNLAYVWGLWDQNIGLNQIEQSGYILCWTAKWYGESAIYYSSREDKTKQEMLAPIHALLDEADAVVHYNGSKFDIPWLNREFIEEGFTPPSPYKEIDLLNTVRSKFKFPSNKLAFVSVALGLGAKIDTTFDLWLGCINNKAEAWKQMRKYNIQDVKLLEKLYVKLLPWVSKHANHSLFNYGQRPVCTNCGSKKLLKRGYSRTLATTYQRYQCSNCGAWCKDNKALDRTAYKTTGIS